MSTTYMLHTYIKCIYTLLVLFNTVTVYFNGELTLTVMLLCLLMLSSKSGGEQQAVGIRRIQWFMALVRVGFKF